uniref:Uncharacterized protein n=1 Tax=Manihot esculenta TaxID=3983 RepID=A0A2C9V4U1_MANES
MVQCCSNSSVCLVCFTVFSWDVTEFAVSCVDFEY